MSKRRRQQKGPLGQTSRTATWTRQLLRLRRGQFTRCINTLLSVNKSLCCVSYENAHKRENFCPRTGGAQKISGTFFGVSVSITFPHFVFRYIPLTLMPTPRVPFQGLGVATSSALTSLTAFYVWFAFSEWIAEMTLLYLCACQVKRELLLLGGQDQKGV